MTLWYSNSADEGGNVMQFRSAEDFRSTVPEKTISIVTSEQIEIEWHLKARLSEREMSINKLAQITGVSYNYLLDYANNKKKADTINMVHVLAIMVALRLSSFDQLLTVTMPHETVVRFDRESSLWIDSGNIPQSVEQFIQ
ncbi:helix-turn-helix domain-containing protein [Enterococcus asini]|uniref:helix-turn-helix domain-containing protein n=1 Tax=Enterococcus asini TaxID=57732 RepID=UPI002892BA29|nr:helix-turn-helix transcriptional regulator [Enterococcus asini]